jgi:hypothetical protein
MGEEIIVNGNKYIREGNRLKTFNEKHKIWVYINHIPEVNNQVESTIKDILTSEYKRAIL